MARMSKQRVAVTDPLIGIRLLACMCIAFALCYPGEIGYSKATPTGVFRRRCFVSTVLPAGLVVKTVRCWDWRYILQQLGVCLAHYLFTAIQEGSYSSSSSSLAFTRTIVGVIDVSTWDICPRHNSRLCFPPPAAANALTSRAFSKGLSPVRSKPSSPVPSHSVPFERRRSHSSPPIHFYLWQS